MLERTIQYYLLSFKIPPRKDTANAERRAHGKKVITQRRAHMCLSNSISLLAVTPRGIKSRGVICPYKNQAGWPFWWTYRNVRLSP